MMSEVGQHSSSITRLKPLHPVTDRGTKICTKCGLELPVNAFYRKPNGYLQPHCRACQAVYARLWRINSPNKARAATRRYYEKPDSEKAYTYASHKLDSQCYGRGVTVSDYLEMFRRQNGKCAICGASHLEFKKGLSIDHDHTTGKVRELLCINCNMALGGFRDDLELLERAINYLKKHGIGTDVTYSEKGEC